MSTATLFERAPPTSLAQTDLRPFVRLEQGWALVRPHYLSLFVFGVLLALSHGLSARLPATGLLNAVIDVFAAAGIAHYLLRALRGEAVHFDDLLTPMRRRPGELVLVAVLQLVLTAIGFVLLILPGLYLVVVLSLAVPFVAFTPLKATEALRRSRELIDARFADWALFLLGLVAANLLGALALGVGLLISLPASAGALALVLADVLGIEGAEPTNAASASPLVTP